MNIIVTRATEVQDLQRVYRFLYRIWIRECGRELVGTDHSREEIRDGLDDWANHFVAMDEQGKIVGCIRINRLSEGTPETGLERGLGLDRITCLFAPESVVFVSHLAILPAYRGGTVISLLLAEVFRYLIETRVGVVLCYCRLSKVSLYHRLGMRPYLPNFDHNGKMQVPLVGCINDRKYLEKTGSPLTMLLPKSYDDKGAAAQILSKQFSMFTAPEFSKITRRNLWAQLAHASPSIGTEPAQKLFQNVAPEVVEDLLQRFPRICLSHNEAIQIGSEWEAAMGVVVQGALGVGVGKASDPHFIYVIRPGEPFGELITLTRIRSGTVILALEKSEVILLPERMFERLGKNEPDTAVHLYKNLLAILARRTAAANTALADHLGKAETTGTKMNRPAHHKALAFRSAAGREEARRESYHFDTLCDPDGELARLTCQASVAEAMELERLREIGLSNGARILDLGAGPGITCQLLARHFPESRIYGVEPEEQLRSKAIAISGQQSPGRCFFLAGTAQKIPLEDNHVDFAYARLLFQHIPDPMVCLEEMKRVTCPGGIVCIMDVDDGTIFIHPEIPEWEAVEKRVSRAQAEYGGDRFVGRKLLGYFEDSGFCRPQLDIVPITTQMLGPELFFDIVFGFKQQHLKRCRDWDEETKSVFADLRSSLMGKGAFASENIFIAHGTVPGE